MSPLVLTIVVVIVVVLVVSIIAYRSGFRLTKLKAKLGIVEAEMTRTPGSGSQQDGEKQAGPAASPFVQEAKDGGVVRKSRIKAPAKPGVSASQRAEGQGSRIDDSHIEIK